MKIADVLPIIFQLGKKRIERVETGAENFNISEALLYLQMCDASLHISCYNDVWVQNIEELGKAIKEERIAYEWSVVELAKKSQVPSTIVYALERGECKLKVDSFLKIALALELIIEIE